LNFLHKTVISLRQLVDKKILNKNSHPILPKQLMHDNSTYQLFEVMSGREHRPHMSQDYHTKVRVIWVKVTLQLLKHPQGQGIPVILK